MRSNQTNKLYINVHMKMAIYYDSKSLVYIYIYIKIPLIKLCLKRIMQVYNDSRATAAITVTLDIIC